MDSIITPVVNAVVMVVEVVIDVVETVIDLVGGDIDRRYQLAGLRVKDDITLRMSGDVVKERDDLSVKVEGSFVLDTGIDFAAVAYVDLRLKYSIWTLNPTFDELRLVMGLETHLDAWLALEIYGAVYFELKIAEVEKTVTIWLGPIPIVLKFYANFVLGAIIKLGIGISADIGYKPILAEVGIQYLPSTGWTEISTAPVFETYGSFGAHATDSDICLYFLVEPYFEVYVGLVVYEFLDVYFLAHLGVPVTLTWPATCSAADACDNNPMQLAYDVQLDFSTFIGLNVGFQKAGLQVYTNKWPIPGLGFKVPIVDGCADLPLPQAMVDMCCDAGGNAILPDELQSTPPPPTPSPTPPPTPPPTYMDESIWWILNHQGAHSAVGSIAADFTDPTDPVLRDAELRLLQTATYALYALIAAIAVWAVVLVRRALLSRQGKTRRADPADAYGYGYEQTAASASAGTETASADTDLSDERHFQA
jgi:hypothetical protein